MQFNKKVAVALAGTSLAVAGAGIAVAAWSTNGTGNGTVTAGNSLALTFAQATTVSGLFPTGSKAVTVQITNPNAYSVQVSALSLGSSGFSASAGCNVDSLSYTGPTAADLAQVIPAGLAKDYTFTVAMSNGANDSCKASTITVPLSATGASSN